MYFFPRSGVLFKKENRFWNYTETFDSQNSMVTGELFVNKLQVD